MKRIKYCYNCKYHKTLYTCEELYISATGRGLCTKEKKVVGDKYYCQHHTRDNKK